MLDVTVLTNNLNVNSKAFNFPILLNSKKLEMRKCKMNIYFSDAFVINNKFSDDLLHQDLLNCDVLIVNSKSIHNIWCNRREYLYDFLTMGKNRGVRILWFDTHDSTACTEFDILPFVDLFLKNQILKNKEEYLEQNSRERIYVKYLNELYGIREERVLNWALPKKTELKKIMVSWNSCYENYTRTRSRIFYKFYQKYIRPNQNFPLLNTVKFTPVEKKRNTNCSCRINKNYRWKAISQHRFEVENLLSNLDVVCDKVSLPLFWKELEDSLVSVGPFGLGEITLRDFEIIITGCALVKPDLSHMDTWPPLFHENETYIPFKWDLSDFIAIVEDLIIQTDKREFIANNAQRVYKKFLLEDEDTSYFTDHFMKILNYL